MVGEASAGVNSPRSGKSSRQASGTGLEEPDEHKTELRHTEARCRDILVQLQDLTNQVYSIIEPWEKQLVYKPTLVSHGHIRQNLHARYMLRKLHNMPQRHMLYQPSGHLTWDVYLPCSHSIRVSGQSTWSYHAVQPHQAGYCISRESLSKCSSLRTLRQECRSHHIFSMTSCMAQSKCKCNPDKPPLAWLFVVPCTKHPPHQQCSTPSLTDIPSTLELV